MSEEEIMQGINKTISFMKEELKADHSCFTIQELWAVNGLLDLYNKEKEKNKKQEKQIEKLLNIKLYACDENKNKECNKKHCYINGGECDRTTDITKVKYINLDEYISKNKIREKIEELEHEIETNSYYLYEENWNKIEVLKELLEEE